jgi:hypothetical protein
MMKQAQSLLDYLLRSILHGMWGMWGVFSREYQSLENGIQYQHEQKGTF